MRGSALILVACACVGNVGALQGPSDAASGPDASTPQGDAGAPDSGTRDAGPRDAGTPDAGSVDAGAADAGPPDAGDGCGSALLCERFESYSTGALSNGASLGPWKVNINDSSAASASIDEFPAGSGNHAFKVHLDITEVSGAQLTTDQPPLFASTLTKVYGRFRMYLAANATSQHWSMVGFVGTVPQGTTTAGAFAEYYFSSFDDGMGNNEFGAVYWNDSTMQDCNTPSTQLMPIGRWACVAYMFDSVAKEYRFSLDGVAVPSLSIDTKGLQCVDHSSNPWWGPDFSSLFIGAYSFHPMNAPLDIWFDDFTVDTNELTCP